MLEKCQQKSIWSQASYVFIREEMRGLISLSTVHLTDLNHVFVCGATLDCFRDISNRGIYSNGYHLYWDSHCFPSQHSGVQNLSILQRVREKKRSAQHLSKAWQVYNPPNNRLAVITSSERKRKVQVTSTTENDPKRLGVAQLATQLGEPLWNLNHSWVDS